MLCVVEHGGIPKPSARASARDNILGRIPDGHGDGIVGGVA